jgi:uncharacterized protein YecE (DUF72 family)
LALIDQRLKILGPKAGPVLFQLPPRFTANPERLDRFMRLVPRRWRVSFEFRDDSWYCSEVFKLLRKHDVALCISDHHDAPAPWRVTAPFVYVRGHGPTGRYKGHYSDSTLRNWSRKVARWKRGRKDVYVYFDNDQKSAAPADALKLMRLLGS